jgi:hypothetical protein
VRVAEPDRSFVYLKKFFGVEQIDREPRGKSEVDEASHLLTALITEFPSQSAVCWFVNTNGVDIRTNVSAFGRIYR